MNLEFRNFSPDYESIVAGIKNAYVTEIAEINISVVYTHDSRNPTLLSGYSSAFEANKSTTESKAKTIFLCWYSWADDFELLSSYFTPDQPGLWNKSIYRHLQLPVSESQLARAIDELLREPCAS